MLLRRQCWTRIFALALFIAWAEIANSTEEVFVEATTQGTAVAINAQAAIKAPYAVIWQTLTDYDHLSEFIPGMTASHVIERRGSIAIVEQSGKARFLLFSHPIDVMVESREEPPASIGMRVIKGNLKQLDGGYRIEKASGRDDEYVLRWSGIIERPSLLPPFIAVRLMRANIAQQFRGMVNEIVRREALRMHGA